MTLAQLSPARAALTVIAALGLVGGLFAVTAEPETAQAAVQLTTIGTAALIIGGVALVARLTIAAVVELFDERTSVER